MPARDKYTVFSPHHRGYRKGIHKVPKWTRVRAACFDFRSSNANSLIHAVNAKNQPERFLGLTHRLIHHYIVSLAHQLL